MATNQTRWVGNLNGAKEPLVMLALFAAGSTTAVKRGEILDLSSGNATPLASDKSMAGIIAVANEEVKAGDLAGYYEVIVPRPGDLFEFELAAAGATAYSTSLYYSSSEKVTVTAGSNIIGISAGQKNYPLKQGHSSSGDFANRGTTVKSQSKVIMTFTAAASVFVKFTA